MRFTGFAALLLLAAGDLHARQQPPASNPPPPATAPPPAPPAADVQPQVPVQPTTFTLAAPPPRPSPITIAPDAPLKDLLPAPPAAKPVSGLPKSLSDVAEVEIQAPLSKLSSDEAMKQIAH